MDCQELFNAGFTSPFAASCVRLGAIVREMRALVQRDEHPPHVLAHLHELTSELTYVQKGTAPSFDYDTLATIYGTLSDANDLLERYGYFEVLETQRKEVAVELA